MTQKIIVISLLLIIFHSVNAQEEKKLYSNQKKELFSKRISTAIHVDGQLNIIH